MSYIGKTDAGGAAPSEGLTGSAGIVEQAWSREAMVPDEQGEMISLFQHNRRAVRTLFTDGTVNIVVFPVGSGIVAEKQYHVQARHLARQAFFEGKEIIHAP